MTERIDVEKAEQVAGDLFGNGFHCAEAVASGVLQSMGQCSQNAVKCSTPFGGGYGESFTGCCGVIAGSLVVVGELCGRKDKGESWFECAGLAREVVEGFTAIHGTTNCGELRDRFGEEAQMDHCRELVRSGTRRLVDILNGDEEGEQKYTTPCSCDAC